MNELTKAGIAQVFHYAPLHYLPFIARSRRLMSKPALQRAGFSEAHFRSMSRQHDVTRGFGNYAHLTTHPSPPILLAKLAAGFPHVRIVIPVNALDNVDFDLCRFNVAMTRYLRRDGKPGFLPSATNGRYYGRAMVPVARTASDQAAMLALHARAGRMIEVLVPDCLRLPDNISVASFSEGDEALVSSVLKKLSIPWAVQRAPNQPSYKAKQAHLRSVHEFVARSLKDQEWRGNGLEFDRLR